MELLRRLGVLCKHTKASPLAKASIFAGFATATLSPWDFRDEPAWKLHDARGLKESPPSSHTLLTQIPGCSMAYRVSIDILHTLDLGVSSRVCGSVLRSWCYKEACNKAQAANNMREVRNSIQEKYKSMKVQERFTNLNLAQFTNAETAWGQAPLLKGRAAEVRHLVPVLASVPWEKASASGGLKESHMAECLHSLACFYDTVSTADFFYGKERSPSSIQSNQECLRHYTRLKANAGNDILFQLTPKFHWAYHLGYMCQWQNPKTYWTYRQESWVGSMSTLARIEPRQPICLVASVRSVCWVSSSGSTIIFEACEKAKHYVTVASQASLLHALKQ